MSKFTKEEMTDILRVLTDEISDYASVSSERAKAFLVANRGLVGKNGIVFDVGDAHSDNGRDFTFAEGFERAWMAYHWLECHSDETGWEGAELATIKLPGILYDGTE